MNLPQRLPNEELPWCEEDVVFLNSGAQEKHLCVEVLRSLGIVARVALAFSRRGFDITKLEFTPSHQQGLANIYIDFPANDLQLEEVKRDLIRLVDVINISVTSDC